jgi:hypothetical protein
MKNIIAGSIGALVGVGACYAILSNKATSPTSIVTVNPSDYEVLKSKLQGIEDQQKADEALGQYVINMMYMSPETIKTLSPARMQVLARSIVRVSNDIFTTEENKRAFVAALQIESRFIKYAQSPTGPKGLGQLARAAFHEGLTNCGIPKANDDDVWETDLNLYGSACYFKAQLVAFNNEPFQAIVAYNQGPNHPDAKNYKVGIPPSGNEPLKYIARFAYLQKVTDKKTPGIPAFKEMPKPSAINSTKEVNNEGSEPSNVD